MKMQRIILALLVSMVFAVPAFALNAKVYVKATQPESKVWGKIRFFDRKEGLLVKGKFRGLTPGSHGLHIHENGSCLDAGVAAGGHFNPDGASHGDAVKNGMAHAHPGDLGNILADAEGNAVIDVMLPGVTLKKGKYSVNRKAIIIHEKADDFSQPAGNAGGRIGCGVIRVKPAEKKKINEIPSNEKKVSEKPAI